MHMPRTRNVSDLVSDTTDVRQLLRGIEVFAGELPTFDPAESPDEPVALFIRWLSAALRAGVREPHATTLSTVDAKGEPAARMLILKDVSERGWQFASDAGSPKGQDLYARPFAALTTYWAPLARQIRVRGPVTSETREECAADFLARGAGARAESLVARQSQPLADLAERDAAVAEFAARLRTDPGLVAPGWTLYTLRPESVEFWQGDRERRHVRLVYRREERGTWSKQMLWP
jgi:pyridoxamine 5'-phosphate oxidase